MRSSILNFDRGIDRVLVQESAVDSTMPHQRKVTPSGTVRLQQVSSLLDAKNLASAVARALVPAIHDRQVLRQEIFEQALAPATEELNEFLQKTKDPHVIEMLENAIGVIDEQRDLQGSLADYRNQLIAG